MCFDFLQLSLINDNQSEPNRTNSYQKFAVIRRNRWRRSRRTSHRRRCKPFRNCDKKLIIPIQAGSVGGGGGYADSGSG